MFIKPASEVERNTDLALFKSDKKPLWECCPEGACLFIRFGKNEEDYVIDIIWEKLIFALIGEQFDDSNIIGALLSVRGRETIIELWFTFNNNEAVKTDITDKMTLLLQLAPANKIYFKDNNSALKVFDLNKILG
jgi:hypothetical protein